MYTIAPFKINVLKPRKYPRSFHVTRIQQVGQEAAIVQNSPDSILKYSRPVDSSENGNLYDLVRDPGEREDLIGRFSPKFLDEMRNQTDQRTER